MFRICGGMYYLLYEVIFFRNRYGCYLVYCCFLCYCGCDWFFGKFFGGCDGFCGKMIIYYVLYFVGKFGNVGYIWFDFY